MLKKTLYVLIIISVTFSCENDKNTEPVEQKPGKFFISLKNIDQESAEIQWSKSKVSQADDVSYDVYFSEKTTVPTEYVRVANKTTKLSHRFNNLTLKTNYYVYIDAHDSQGNTRREIFGFTTDDTLPPNDFQVTTTLNKELTAAVVNWTEAIDPEGKKVVYDVYLNGELVESDLEKLTQDITSPPYVTENIIEIQAKDSDGGVKKITQTFTTCAPDISGTYNVVTRAESEYSDLGTFKNYPSQVTIIKNTDGSYTFSDITAGVWSHWATIPAATVDNCGTYGRKDFVLGKFGTLTWSGKFNPNETITVKWEVITNPGEVKSSGSSTYTKI